MKNYFILLVFLLSMPYSFSKEYVIPDYLVQTQLDGALKKGEAKFQFIFPNLMSKRFLIHFNIDNNEKRIHLKKGDTLTLMSVPGDHRFQFYTDDYHEEIYLNKETIKDRHVSLYAINFREAPQQIICEKPVIYLYTEKDQDVTVRLKPKGKLLMTYPKYENEWKLKASPNGNLHVNGKNYNYLFWESNQQYRQSATNASSGFIVEKEKTISFLKQKLTIAGLNTMEQADFITYWGPKLLQNEFNYIRFEINEACNQFAELQITPKPDHVNRIYITWRKSNGKENKKEQIIPKFDRTGFDVLEWGGMEIKETMLAIPVSKKINSL